MIRFNQLILLTVVLLFFMVIPVESLEVSSNIIQRVFLIKYGNSQGSSFTIEVGNRQYLITARHVVEGVKDGDQIQILHNSVWKTFNVKPLYIQPDLVDTIVLVLPIQISPSYPLEPTMAGLFLSQTMYFLGFPYGLHADDLNVNNGFPLPFVKSGICSAIFFGKEYNLLFIDGFNNPGFSGGPIVFMDKSVNKLKVAGVVQGYRYQEEKVMRKSDKEEMKKTDMIVKTNAGIIVGYDIKSAVDVILKNPIGPLVETK